MMGSMAERRRSSRLMIPKEEHEAGAKTADLTREHGISEPMIYNWKTKFSGMDVSEAERGRS